MCFEMVPVESSNIANIGFYLSDMEMQIGELYVRFKSGQVFRYFDVPRERHKAFMDAKSKGKYFASFIRKKYKGEMTKEADNGMFDEHGITTATQPTRNMSNAEIPGEDKPISRVLRTGAIDL